LFDFKKSINVTGSPLSHIAIFDDFNRWRNVIDKPSSNGNFYDCAFAPEPQAQTPEKVRLEILCGCSDSHLPLLLRDVSQQEVDEKANTWSKETFPLQRGVV
jgi:hypothetical protein